MMEMNEKVVTDDHGVSDEKMVAKNEPNYRGIKAMPFVIGNETFEKLGTLGTSSNLLVYLTSVFNMKTISATNLLNIFNGTCYFGSLLGAFLSDTYFGRYKTLGFASVASFLGMLVLTLTAAVTNLHPHSCSKDATASTCSGPTAGQIVFLISGFGLLVIGASGIRPCNLAFGADQFNPNTESGRRGTNSFFNWYYFTYTFAVMVSMTIIVYVQSNLSWSIGLAIPTMLMFCSCALFFAGTRMYVKVAPQGSPLMSVAQVIAAAVKKRRLEAPVQPWLSLFNYEPANSINAMLPYTDQFRFLDKAAIITLEDKINTDGSMVDPWRLCSIQQVEEVKCLLRLVPIWIAGLMFQVAVVQQQNYVVFQALQSDRRLSTSHTFKIPAATYNVFSMMSLTFWLPIYDRIIIPFFRKHTKKEDGVTLLQRMGTGIVLAILAMILSGIVEKERRGIAFTKPTLGVEPRKGDISSMSAYWLVPQLALIGLAEGFTFIGENELFYKQCPENMRSMASSFVLAGVAGSSYLSSFVSSIVQRATKRSWLAEDLNKGRLDYFFYLIAGLEVLNLVYFMLCARWYKYKGIGDKGIEVSMEKLQGEKGIV
ncbi:hypothetical protein LguiA_009561 [Lonicera macranthoides]